MTAVAQQQVVGRQVSADVAECVQVLERHDDLGRPLLDERFRDARQWRLLVVISKAKVSE